MRTYTITYLDTENTTNTGFDPNGARMKDWILNRAWIVPAFFFCLWITIEIAIRGYPCEECGGYIRHGRCRCGNKQETDK